jgi:hypothetical protein
MSASSETRFGLPTEPPEGALKGLSDLRKRQFRTAYSTMMGQLEDAHKPEKTQRDDRRSWETEEWGLGLHHLFELTEMTHGLPRNKELYARGCYAIAMAKLKFYHVAQAKEEEKDEPPVKKRKTSDSSDSSNSSSSSDDSSSEGGDSDSGDKPMPLAPEPELPEDPPAQELSAQPLALEQGAPQVVPVVPPALPVRARPGWPHGCDIDAAHVSAAVRSQLLRLFKEFTNIRHLAARGGRNEWIHTEDKKRRLNEAWGLLGRS